jgi:hypothetical protein
LKINEKKKLIDFGRPPRKCAYQAFIIQKLDVVTLELSIKVQFANFDKLNLVTPKGPRGVFLQKRSKSAISSSRSLNEFFFTFFHF